MFIYIYRWDMGGGKTTIGCPTDYKLFLNITSLSTFTSGTLLNPEGFTELW